MCEEWMRCMRAVPHEPCPKNLLACVHYATPLVQRLACRQCAFIDFQMVRPPRAGLHECVQRDTRCLRHSLVDVPHLICRTTAGQEYRLADAVRVFSTFHPFLAVQLGRRGLLKICDPEESTTAPSSGEQRFQQQLLPFAPV